MVFGYNDVIIGSTLGGLDNVGLGFDNTSNLCIMYWFLFTYTLTVAQAWFVNLDDGGCSSWQRDCFNFKFYRKLSS